MGKGHEFTGGLNEQEWIEKLYNDTRDRAHLQKLKMPSYNDFLRKGWFKFKDPEEHTIMLKEYRQDPVKYPLDTPSGKIEIFSSTVEGFNYEDCPGHPVWQEPVEWLGNASKKYPLHLISNQPKDKLHSQLDHGCVSRSRKNKR